MDDKDLDQELDFAFGGEPETDDNAKEKTDSVDDSESKREVELEQNDDWEFEAEAPTLNDSLYVGDFEVDLPETDESIKLTKTKVVDTTKGSDQVVISKKPFKIAFYVIIFLAVVGVLVFFGYKYYTTPNMDEKMNPGNVAMSVGDTDVSVGMYNYYYYCVSQNYIQYASYGYYDLDTTQSYDSQTTTDDDGNEISWMQLFENETINQIQYICSYYQKAVELGYTLTDEQKSTIKEQIKSLESSASENAVTVDEYVSSQYGDYCGEATLKKMLEQCYIAENYFQDQNIETTVSPEEITSYFEKNKDSYQSVDFAYLQMKYDTTDEDSKAESVKKAKDYMKKITDFDSMKAMIPTVCTDLISQYMSYYSCERDEAISQIGDSIKTSIKKDDTVWEADVINWLFSESTDVNSVTYSASEDDGYIYIVIKLDKPTYNESNVCSVRQILITPSTDEEDTDTDTDSSTTTTYTEDQWAEAKVLAKSILEKYKAGDMTELEFAKLAEKYSDDTESTSSGSSGVYGGLYENMDSDTLDGYVKEFRTWCTADHETGDTAIIKTSYGYHIMYYIGAYKEYESEVISAIKTDKENQFIDEHEVKKHHSFNKTSKAKPSADTSTSTDTGANTSSAQ